MGSHQRRLRANIRQGLVLLVVVLLASLGVWQYSNSITERGWVSLSFHNTDGSDSTTFKLEVARTPSEQEKGLMYRKEMPEKHGMVFAYPNQSVKTFWMKNTYIPLDMIFIDSRMQVVGILHQVPILNEERRQVEKPSQYVVELNAGAAQKYNIREGATAHFVPRDF